MEKDGEDGIASLARKSLVFVWGIVELVGEVVKGHVLVLTTGCM